MTGACYRVLAVDGGGIRGLIAARVLKEIETRMHRPIAEMFDLVAGTSTGGILALGLTKPDPSGRPRFTADDMCDLYLNDARAGGRALPVATHRAHPPAAVRGHHAFGGAHRGRDPQL